MVGLGRRYARGTRGAVLTIITARLTSSSLHLPTMSVQALAGTVHSQNAVLSCEFTGIYTTACGPGGTEMRCEDASRGTTLTHHIPGDPGMHAGGAGRPCTTPQRRRRGGGTHDGRHCYQIPTILETHSSRCCANCGSCSTGWVRRHLEGAVQCSRERLAFPSSIAESKGTLYV